MLMVRKSSLSAATSATEVFKIYWETCLRKCSQDKSTYILAKSEANEYAEQYFLGWKMGIYKKYVCKRSKCGKWEYMCKYLQNGRHSTEGFHSLLRCRYWRETKALPIISSLSLRREKGWFYKNLVEKKPLFKLKGEIDILSANVNWPRGLTFVPASPFVLPQCILHNMIKELGSSFKEINILTLSKRFYVPGTILMEKSRTCEL